MDYKILKSASNDFTEGLNTALIFFRRLSLSVTKNSLEEELIIKIIKGLETLKEKIKCPNSKELYFPYISVSLGFIKIEDSLSIPIILKILKDTNKFSYEELCPYCQRGFLKMVNGSFKEMNSLVDGYEVKKGKEKEFRDSYFRYLKTVSNYITFLLDKSNLGMGTKAYMYECLRSICDRQLSLLDEYMCEYDRKYKSLIEVEPRKSKVYKRNLSPIYTEDNLVHYYIKGGQVQNLCSPKYLDSLLVLNGYPKEARKNLLRQMINKLRENPDVCNSLIGEELGLIDLDLKKKWDYILIAKEDYIGLDTSYVYTLFFTVAGLDLLNNQGMGYLGVGYTDSDIKELMIDGVNELYKRAKRDTYVPKRVLN